MINIVDWLDETLPANMYRGLDGKPYEFGDVEEIARSGHDPIFKLNSNYGWGVRWYALERWNDRYIFTVGYGYWCARREVPAEIVPEILFRFFTRNEITEAGKALLENASERR